jgi:4-diphosphocytidyl-2-C-methyl-D-erythritol kinase
MNHISLLAPAKINLYLEILGLRDDGYHELVMVMQSIDLCDRLTLTKNNSPAIFLHSNTPNIPLDHTNLAHRAAQLMIDSFPDAYHRYGGVEITLEKHIPIAAGLAGGSGNAAGVLVGINLLWDLGLSQIELQELGAKLGSDVPFSITGGTAIATGRGEKIAPLNPLDHLYVVLGKYQSIEVSTPWAYNSYREQFQDQYLKDSQGFSDRLDQVHSSDLVQGIAHKNSLKIGSSIYNDLEKVVLTTYPLVQQLKTVFQQTTNLGVMMSGSGPTVFALADSESQGQEILQQVRHAIPNPDLELFSVPLCTQGVRIS